MKSLFGFAVLASSALAALALPISMTTTPAPVLPDIPTRTAIYNLQVGPIALDFEGEEERLIESIEVKEANAVWLRVFFDDVQLTPSSRVVVTSLLHNHKQSLSPEALKNWGMSSAYFNGDALRVEIFAEPEPSAVVGLKIGRLLVGKPKAKPNTNTTVIDIETVCDDGDTRTLSQDPRAARYLPSGCSVWLINDAAHCYLTAGHCDVGAEGVAQFNVPLSNPDGSLVHPAPEHQYHVDPESVYGYGNGIGNDWAYFGTFPNSDTGKTAFEAQGSAYELELEVPNAENQELVITGYGTSSNYISKEWNQVQKTAVGAFSKHDSTGNFIRHRVDTTGGNSGSAVELNGKAIGIHTHGGCDSGAESTNAATSMVHPDLQNALRNPKGICKA